MAASLSRLGSVGLIPQRSEKCLNSHWVRLAFGKDKMFCGVYNVTASEKKETSPDHVFKRLVSFIQAERARLG